MNYAVYTNVLSVKVARAKSGNDVIWYLCWLRVNHEGWTARDMPVMLRLIGIVRNRITVPRNIENEIRRVKVGRNY